MDGLLPDEVPAIREMVQQFMAAEVSPVLDDFEVQGVLPRALIKKAGSAGLFGSVFPESLGGTGAGYLVAVIILEEISRVDIRFAGCSNQQAGTCPTCIYLSETAEQIETYVPKLLAGNAIGMMSLTESGGGSDAAGGMKTVARRDDDVYRVNGSKMWATLGHECDSGILLAKTDPDAGVRGVSAFIIEPKKYPGFCATPIDTFGLSRAFRTAALYFDNFVVPTENRLGREGDGFEIITRGDRGKGARLGPGMPG